MGRAVSLPLARIAASHRGGTAGTLFFDPALHGVNVVLSNGDQDATKAGAGYQTTYGIVGHSSGRHAFEMLVTAWPSVSSLLIGIADKTNSSAVIATYLGTSGTTESIGYNENNGSNSGRFYRRMTIGNIVGQITSTDYGADDVITVDVDQAANTVTFYLNGFPVPTGPFAITDGKTYYPAVSIQNGSAVRLIPTGLSFLPAGSEEWG